MDEITLEKKLQEITEYLQNYGATYEFYCKKADLLYLIGEYEQAINILKTVLTYKINSAEIWFQIGQCYLQLNCLEYGLLAFANAAKDLKQSGQLEQYQLLIQCVKEIEGITTESLNMFDVMVNRKQHHFVFLSSQPWHKDSLEPEVQLALSLHEMGYYVAYIQVDTSIKSVEMKDIDNGIFVYKIYDDRSITDLLHRIKQQYGDLVICTSLHYQSNNLMEFYIKETVIFLSKETVQYHNKDMYYGVYWAKANISFDIIHFLENYLLHNIYSSYYVPRGLYIAQQAKKFKIDTALASKPTIVCYNVNSETLQFVSTLVKKNTNYNFVVLGDDDQTYSLNSLENVLKVDQSKNLFESCNTIFELAIVFEGTQENEIKQIYYSISHNIPVITSNPVALVEQSAYMWYAHTQEEIENGIFTILNLKASKKQNDDSNFICNHSWLSSASMLIRIVEDSILQKDCPQDILNYVQTQLKLHEHHSKKVKYMEALCAVQYDFKKFQKYFSGTDRYDQSLLIDRDGIKKYQILNSVYHTINHVKEDSHKKIVVIAGYFGGGNFGDELLLQIMLNHLEQTESDLVVLGVDPERIWKQHHVKALDLKQTSAIEQVIQQSSLVILGPGGIIQDGICPEYYGNILVGGVYGYLFPVRMANLYARVAICVGVGAESITKKGAANFIYETLKKSPLLWLRDVNSKKCFVDLGLKNTKVYPDVSFLLDQCQLELKEKKKNKQSKILGVNLRRLCLENANIHEVIKVIFQYIDLGWNISLICADKEEDKNILHEIYQLIIKAKGDKMKHKVKLVYSESNDTILKEISKVDFMMAMRLHIGLVAAQMGIPTIFLSYLDKVASIAQQLGMEEYTLQTSECYFENLIEKLDHLVEHQQEIKIILEKKCTEIREEAQHAWQEVEKFLP